MVLDTSAIAIALLEEDLALTTQIARQRLEHEVASRERLLASTRERLGRLGWVGRRRQGPELREVVGVQQRILGALRAELAELPTREVRARRAALERPTVSRTREREARRSRELGIDLEL